MPPYANLKAVAKKVACSKFRVVDCIAVSLHRHITRQVSRTKALMRAGRAAGAVGAQGGRGRARGAL